MFINRYLVWGRTFAPAVIVLSDEEQETLSNYFVQFKGKSWLAYGIVFGEGATHALPTTPRALEFVIESYDGPHKDRMQYLAACVLLGRPFDADPGQDGGGAVDKPTAPFTRPPSGSKLVLNAAIGT